MATTICSGVESQRRIPLAKRRFESVRGLHQIFPRFWGKTTPILGHTFRFNCANVTSGERAADNAGWVIPWPYRSPHAPEAG
jgi:hypothetical protein